jgi:cystathionine beta-synthase
MSQEKEDVLTAMGVKVIRCENVSREHPLSNISIAKKMSVSPNMINLDQYENKSNPMVHYDQTAEELITQCDGKIDYFIVSPGTGGTMTGVSRKLKEKLPNVKIIATDPSGSILSRPESLNVGGYKKYKVEGIGQPFIPGNVTYDCVDEWIKVDDKDAFVMARRLLKEEGLMVGGSSGLAFAGAIQYIKKNKIEKDKRVIVFFCDGIRNYLSTFLSDDWMIENNFMSKEEYDDANYKDREDIKKRLPGKIADIKDKLKEANILKNIENINVRDLLKIFNEKKINVILVLNEKNELLGYLSKKNVTCSLASCKVDLDSNVINVLTKDIRVLNLDDPLYFLSRALPRFDFLPIKIDNEKYLIIEYENIYDFLSKEI